MATATPVEGKAVLVTGASNGIGQALVTEALRRGAARVYAGTRLPLPHPDPHVTSLRLDVTSTAEVRAAADQIESLDILVNNAGIARYDDLADGNAIDQSLAVNLLGTYGVTTAFLPLLAGSGGAVVAILSILAIVAPQGTGESSVSRAVAFNMTEALRALLAGSGVSVHAVLAGPTGTGMNRSHGLPQFPAASVAEAIFDGVEAGAEDIFPDPVSEALADSWRSENGLPPSLVAR